MPLQSSSCFWAKLGRGSYPQDAHPVICHLLDVGNVAATLWSVCLSDRTRERWAVPNGGRLDRSFSRSWQPHSD
ncbi:MAG: hypothetical protein HZA46_06780 [Planctomycetales bacterium]|nr:hypothetical protein [Planctomycetales bacterium]